MRRSGSKIARPAAAVLLALLLGAMAQPARADAAPDLSPISEGGGGTQTPAPVEERTQEESAPAADAGADDPPHIRRVASRRGGINPCMTPDPGFGIYDRWSRNISMGQMLAPQRGGLTTSGGFDLIVHFHGHYPVRKEFVKVADGVVLVAIDLGVGSGAYSAAFASPDVFEKLLDSVEREMARRSGRKKTYVRKLALSSWSAGYGAVAQILQQPAGKKVDALILLDSVHAGYVDPHAERLDKRLKTNQIEPFVEFARRAARGQKLMFQSHSSIIPPGYASTREVSHYMVEKLGGKLRKASRSDVLGLKLDERYDRRGYHVRGYEGEDKPDHCAHLGLFKDVLKVHLGPRWRSPKGKRGKRAAVVARQQARREGRLHVVASGEHLTGIAKHYGVTVSALRDANGLERGKPLQIGQELIVPEGGGPGAGGGGDASPSLRPGEKIHVVVEGQSLGRIAKRYHVTVAELRERNDLEKGGRAIQPGDELVIPRPGSKKRSDSKKGKKGDDDPKLRPGEKIHVVARGQSLGKIAKRYHVTVADLRARNDLEKGGRPIQPGDKLVIPKK